MRTAIISDIHGNFEALQRVLHDIDTAGVDDLICLGDNVGYGPEPEEVVSCLRRRKIISLKGNHELALLSKAYFKRLNPSAQKSIRVTRSLVSRSTLLYCDTLPASLSKNGCRFVHGCPPRAITRYLFHPDADELQRLFRAFSEPLCFFGHTHNLAVYSLEDGQAVHYKPGEETIALAPDKRYIINVGSVGQPRDGNNTAKYAIYDQKTRTVEIRYVPYDIQKTAKKILALDFPDFNASRLF